MSALLQHVAVFSTFIWIQGTQYRLMDNKGLLLKDQNLPAEFWQKTEAGIFKHPEVAVRFKEISAHQQPGDAYLVNAEQIEWEGK